jgi:hypothetical protein
MYSPLVNFTNPVSSIFLPRVTPYLDTITVDHLCGFRGDRSSADGVYFIRQIGYLKKMWKCMGAIHRRLYS